MESKIILLIKFGWMDLEDPIIIMIIMWPIYDDHEGTRKHWTTYLFFHFKKGRKILTKTLLLGAIVLTGLDTYKNLNVSQCQRR